jgi:hypothetical protein
MDKGLDVLNDSDEDLLEGIDADMMIEDILNEDEEDEPDESAEVPTYKEESKIKPQKTPTRKVENAPLINPSILSDVKKAANLTKTPEKRAPVPKNTEEQGKSEGN